MKRWFQGAIVLLLLSAITDSENTLQSRTPFSLTYEYRIDLNASEAIPSIEDAIDELHVDTMEAIEQLVEDGDDPLFVVVALDTEVQGSCQGSSDLCSLAESTAMLSLRSNVDDRLVEFAALEEVQSLLKSFNGDHDEVFVYFQGPYVVRTDISLLLEGVSGRMTTTEIEVFENTFMDIIGPPLLSNEPSVVLRSATVFLQQILEQRRRLQARNGNKSVVVSVHVTGQCNQCSNNDFSRIMGEAVDIRRPDFERDLRDNGQDAGTDFFDNVKARIAMMEEAPGISDCCLDFYPPPDPFPYWVFIVTGTCVVLITVSVCCAACRSRRERTKQQEEARAKMKQPIARTRTEDATEDGANESGERRDREVMPHLRKATQQRLARKNDSARNAQRASSLTF